MSDADHRDSDRRETRKRDLISQEAAEWFARMKDPNVPLDERQRFLRWLKQSQVHVAEYLRVADIDGGLRRAALSCAMTDEAPSNVVPLFAGESERSTQRGAALLQWKVAAAIVVCALATLLFLGVGAAWYERSIETDLGEWKTVALADGSELQLGPNTRLTVDLGDTQRSIVLMRGEAYFKVAKETRPFQVQAKAFAVRAVGTEFAVSRRNDELIVTVREGKVRVTPSTKSTKSGVSADEPWELSVPIPADYQLRITDNNTWPVTPNRIDVRYELAWREKQLMFKVGDTLADAVVEFNLRNHVKLQLDPRAASLPVRGSFDASNPVAFAQTVDKISPVVVQRLAADTLLIKSE